MPLECHIAASFCGMPSGGGTDSDEVGSPAVRLPRTMCKDGICVLPSLHCVMMYDVVAAAGSVSAVGGATY